MKIKNKRKGKTNKLSHINAEKRSKSTKRYVFEKENENYEHLKDPILKSDLPKKEFAYNTRMSGYAYMTYENGD